MSFRLLGALSTLIAGCTSPATEVLVHIQTDLPPEELDTYTIRVRSSLANEARSFTRAEAGKQLPASFSIGSRDGEIDRAVTIVSEGLFAGRSVVTATLAFDHFTAQQTRHICIFLAAACIDRSCPDGQSCGFDGCAPYLVEPSEAADSRCLEPVPPKPVIWWNEAWGYRIDVTLGSGDLARRDHPVELEINFGEILDAPFDPDSPRVVEHDLLSGDVIGERPSYYHHGPGPEAGVLFFSMDGETAPHVKRRYGIYFDAGDSHDPATYWLEAATSQVEDGIFGLQNIAQQGGAELGIGASLTDFSPNTTEHEGFFFRGTKVRSTRPPGFDHGTPILGNIADNNYPQGRALLRLDQDDIKIVECSAVIPPLTIRETTILTRGSWARFYTRFENNGAEELTELRYFEVVDFDVGTDIFTGRDNNRGAYDATLDMLYAAETSRRPNVVALGASIKPAGYSVDDTATVFAGVHDNGLNNRSAIDDAEISVAFEHSVSAILPLGATAVRSALVSRESLTAAAVDIAMLRAPLEERRSGLIRRP